MRGAFGEGSFRVNPNEGLREMLRIKVYLALCAVSEIKQAFWMQKTEEEKIKKKEPRVFG